MPEPRSRSIIRVDNDRWREAQEWEEALWKRYQQRRGWRGLAWPFLRPALTAIRSPRAHRDDWNHWWASHFDNYEFLPWQLESIIELGCGPYTNARLILRGRKANRVVLSDPLIETYAQFSENWLGEQHRRGKVELDNSPAEDVSFADHSFEVVVLINVLDHVRDATLCLERATRLVRGGGYLLLGQELTNEEDSSHASYDAGHPIRLDYDDIEPWMHGFEPVLRKVLARSVGRSPEAHHATLIYAGLRQCTPT